MPALGMDVDAMRHLARQLVEGASQMEALSNALTAGLHAAPWCGPGADAFRAEWGDRHRARLSAAAGHLNEASERLLREVQDQVDASSSKHAPLEGGAAPLFLPGAPGRVDQSREDRRVRNDEISRTEPGGRGGGWLNNDWAGRQMLDQYLTGGGDWSIDNDPDWNRYMMEHPALNEELRGRAELQAQHLVAQYRQSGATGITFNDTFHMEVENGEGITGYEYLHGTNKDVGDFNMAGSANLRSLPDGTYEVTVDAHYTWNDVIDPNPKYSTDSLKSTVAEILTAGRAEGYDLHIRWPAQAVVRLSAEGEVLGVNGYPGDR